MIIGNWLLQIDRYAAKHEWEVTLAEKHIRIISKIVTHICKQLEKQRDLTNLKWPPISLCPLLLQRIRCVVRQTRENMNNGRFRVRSENELLVALGVLLRSAASIDNFHSLRILWFIKGTVSVNFRQPELCPQPHAIRIFCSRGWGYLYMPGCKPIIGILSESQQHCPPNQGQFAFCTSWIRACSISYNLPFLRQ